MIELYVSTKGNDRWSGKLSDPAAGNLDGPLATIEKARDAIRQLKTQGALSADVQVLIRGGTYPIVKPIVFAPEDSYPVTYTAFPGEKVIFEGGRRIEGWTKEETDDQEIWVADIPDVARGHWYFKQLFVNGERRVRARLPKKGYYWIDSVPDSRLDAFIFDGSDSFISKKGDFLPWKNITDVEVVVLHYWVEERMPVQSFDEENNLIVSSRKSLFALRDDRSERYAKYYVENIAEALEEPGEWYLDRKSGKLKYIPMPGEDLAEAEIYAPVTTQFIRFEGKPQNRKYIDFIRIKNLEFRHSEWIQPYNTAANFVGKKDEKDYAAVPQASYNVPGVVYLEGARNCSIEKCILRNIGWYGFELAGGCMANTIAGNEIIDAGAGGIKLIGTNSQGMLGGGSVSWMMDTNKVDEEGTNPLLRRNGFNKITDNHIYKAGRVFHSAVGIFIADSQRNDICHNHIHDLFYTGISCGFIWAYGDNMCYGNKIEKNHIHLIGQALLSDMGGVYLLGVQPGTVVRGNLIHDVERASYGGWGIYTDEGSSHIIIENNICYKVSSQLFHQHYGRENVVRNNIFAFGREGIAAYSRPEEHIGFTFERNIALVDNQPYFTNTAFGKCKYISDLNIVWDISGKEVKSGKITWDHDGKLLLDPVYSTADLKAMGLEMHSILADPCFQDAANFDFSLKEGSPALAIGFVPIDLSDVGPRASSEP
jgi:parallel beta-helix repeat protein